MQPPITLANPLTDLSSQTKTGSLRRAIDREISSALNHYPAHLHRQVYTCPIFHQRLTGFILDRLSSTIDSTIERQAIQHITQSGIHYLLHEETLQQMKYKSSAFHEQD